MDYLPNIYRRLEKPKGVGFLFFLFFKDRLGYSRSSVCSLNLGYKRPSASILEPTQRMVINTIQLNKQKQNKKQKNEYTVMVTAMNWRVNKMSTL